jgi:integrase
VSKPLRVSRSWFDRALKDAKAQRFRWHDLRPTAASRLQRKGANVEVIAAICQSSNNLGA